VCTKLEDADEVSAANYDRVLQTLLFEQAQQDQFDDEEEKDESCSDDGVEAQLKEEVKKTNGVEKRGFLAKIFGSKESKTI